MIPETLHGFDCWKNEWGIGENTGLGEGGLDGWLKEKMIKSWIYIIKSF